MRHALYEDPITHRFAFIRLPKHFADGDTLPILPSARWFTSRDEAIAALPELFNRDDDALDAADRL